MARPKSLKPAHIHHKASNRGCVKLNGDWHYTGKWGTQATRDKYDRLIGEWIARNRMAALAPAGPTEGATVEEVLAGCWLHCKAKYTRADGTVRREVLNIQIALRPLRRLYGDMVAAEVAPEHLEALRASMVRAGNCRNYVNRNVRRIVAAFAWGVRKKMVPVMVSSFTPIVPMGYLIRRAAARKTRGSASRAYGGGEGNTGDGV